MSLLTEAQTLTTSWADVGDEINVNGASVLGLWATVTQKDSNPVQFRFLPKRASAGREEYGYLRPVVNGSTKTSLVDVDTLQEHYFEILDSGSPNSERHVYVPFELYHLVPYVQLQVKVTNLGATAGDINSVYVTEGLK